MATESELITIVLADDHAVVRSGLRMVLERAGGFEVVSEAGDAEAALRTVLGPQADGARPRPQHAGRAQLARRHPARAGGLARTRASSILTMQEDPEFARRALRAGAAGYVLKEAADDELVDAVRRVAEGGTYLNPRLGAVLAAAPPEPAGPPDDLTEREVEVLRLIALGHTNAEIAERALPLGAHRRVPPRAHPAEARPLHPRRARALRARPRLRRAPSSRSASGSRARITVPASAPRQHAELPAGELDALAHAGQPEAARRRGLGVEADAVVGHGHLDRVARAADRDVDRGGVARA